MRIILILLSVFLLTGCYREYPVELIPIDKDEGIFVIDPGYGTDCEDDSEIIQEALDEHGVVKLPTGLYYLDTTITMTHNMKLIGEGIPGRYPDTSAFGTAINIGNNVETLFKVSGYGVEIKGMSFTGTGQNLESIIEVTGGGGNLLFQDLLERDIKWYDGGWQKAPYTFIRFTGTASNTVIIDRVFAYAAHWFIRQEVAVYFMTMKNGRCIWTDNGVYINGAATSFRCANYAMEQITGPAFQIGSNGWADMHFENIHNEWAWPFILNEAVSRPVINIDGMYGWGYEGEEINLIENTSKGSYISVKNSVLYNTRGYNKNDDFPIKDWAKYSYGVTLENVKIKDSETHKYHLWNKYPAEGLEAVSDRPLQRLFIHADQHNDTIIPIKDPENGGNVWEFGDSTQFTFDGNWSFLGNSEGHFVIIAEPNDFNSHVSYLFRTGTENGVRLYFQNARLIYHIKKEGAYSLGFLINGHPVGLTHCIVGSQEIVNDSLHFKFLYDNFEGYSNMINFTIQEYKIAVSDLPTHSDHNLHIGDSTGLSIDGNFTLAEFAEGALTEPEMYEIIYSLKKHYGWQHSNLGLF